MFSTKSLKLDVFFKYVMLSSAIFILCCFLYIKNSVAQGNPELEHELEVTYQKILENPSDVDLTMHYAKIAVELGDYEAAIPPLERILMFNPNLPKVKYEIGVLYYNLDSYKMAKSYFLDAMKTKDVTKDIENKSRLYIGKIEDLGF